MESYEYFDYVGAKSVSDINISSTSKIILIDVNDIEAENNVPKIFYDNTSNMCAIIRDKKKRHHVKFWSLTPDVLEIISSLSKLIYSLHIGSDQDNMSRMYDMKIYIKLRVNHKSIGRSVTNCNYPAKLVEIINGLPNINKLSIGSDATNVNMLYFLKSIKNKKIQSLFLHQTVHDIAYNDILLINNIKALKLSIYRHKIDKNNELFKMLKFENKSIRALYLTTDHKQIDYLFKNLLNISAIGGKLKYVSINDNAFIDQQFPCDAFVWNNINHLQNEIKFTFFC